MSDSPPSLSTQRLKYQWYRDYDESGYQQTPDWEIQRSLTWGQMDVDETAKQAIGIYNQETDDRWLTSTGFVSLMEMC